MATPFPWLPMLAISIGLVSHAYAFTSLFPYVGYMVLHLGVTDDKDEAGYYAGYVSSAFMIGRFASSYFWGRFADRYGRLPVIYVALGSTVVLSIAFGLSTTFVWALGCRFLLGVTNGLMGISKTMISEVCGKEHEMVGMGYILGCWSIGLVIGPGLGGLLAKPATHYPTIFSESGLFGRFPYLLPNIIGASLALIGMPIVLCFLKETKHLHTSRRESGSEFKPLPTSEVGDVETPDTAIEEEEGRMLEMMPLTQTNPLEDGRGGGGDERRLEGISLKRSRAAGYAGEVAVGNETVDDDDDGGCISGGAGHSEEEGHQLLSTRRANDQPRPDFAGEGWRNHVHGGFHGNSRGTGDLEEVKVVDGDGRGDESQRRRRKSACWRECLVPAKLLEDKRTRAILFVYTASSFITIGSREVYPLWALSTVASGGLDWTTKQIGQALSTCGLGMLVFQLLVYPRLSRWLGVTTIQRWSCFISIPVFLAFPFLSRLRNSGTVLVVASLVLLFLTNIVASMISINVSLATNNAVDPSRRATLNGLSMTTSSLAKAAGPAFFSAIFAWSVDGDRHPFPFDHHLVFYLLALGMLVVNWASWDTIVSREPAEAKAAPSVAVAGRAEKTAQRACRESSWYRS